MTRGCATSLKRALGGVVRGRGARGLRRRAVAGAICARRPTSSGRSSSATASSATTKPTSRPRSRSTRSAPDDVAAHADTFERAVRKLRGRMMPPPGGARSRATPRTTRSSRGSRRRSMPRRPTPAPGYVTPHRMNRTEYANAIRDLLALEVDPATLLPVDGAEHGFDNIANALTVSPSFIDQFLSAARNLSAQAVGNAQRARRRRAVHDRQCARAAVPRADGLPLGTRGGARHRALLPGRRRIPAQHRQSRDGPLGLQPRAQGDASSRMLDGRKFFELDIGGGQDLKELDQIGAPAVDAINARLKNIPFTATAGVHRLGVTFLHRSFAESDRQLYSQVPGGGQDTVLTLNQLEVFGPVNATGLEQHAEPRQDLRLSPESARARDRVPRSRAPSEIVAALAREAFRGAFDCRRFAAADAPLRRRRRERRLREGRRARARRRARASEVPVSVRAEAGRRRARRRRIRCRASSSRRGSPSSYGARSPMPSCSSSPRPIGSPIPPC